MENIKNEIAIYQSESGAIEIAIDFKKETLLLTQQQVAQLFGIKKAAISKHVKNIFASAELEKESTVSILETVQKEGDRKIVRKIEYYNLDLVLSIGYRVNSLNATRFRRWATTTLKEHIIKGYSIVLTALTLLIAESNPKDKDRMIGVILLILESGKK
ncbi:MAG: hypothetical protein EVJ48_01010 [Candidatus Acidulodesulfobacterium acidiphilum]|uniref:Death-on-curing protein n=1 Tax=Candidatus Acidulodesulfobacterium acidiphilum TaxID=2597224 RepID=A0A520XH54_9DELT|nr:MAG: hypothetical protein EVJ48_01010 [Candidatus Acidulodesulfobacterium acidiphilum]